MHVSGHLMSWSLTFLRSCRRWDGSRRRRSTATCPQPPSSARPTPRRNHGRAGDGALRQHGDDLAVERHASPYGKVVLAVDYRGCA